MVSCFDNSFTHRNKSFVIPVRSSLLKPLSRDHQIKMAELLSCHGVAADASENLMFLF